MVGVPSEDPERLKMVVFLGGIVLGSLSIKGDSCETLVYENSHRRDEVMMSGIELEQTADSFAKNNQLEAVCTDLARQMVHDAAKMPGWHGFMENLTYANLNAAKTSALVSELCFNSAPQGTVQ
jgi:hypothetical protein